MPKSSYRNESIVASQRHFYSPYRCWMHRCDEQSVHEIHWKDTWKDQYMFEVQKITLLGTCYSERRLFNELEEPSTLSMDWDTIQTECVTLTRCNVKRTTIIIMVIIIIK